jgi:cysteine-rich repeat protein
MRSSRRHACRYALLASLVVAVPGIAAAQILEQPLTVLNADLDSSQLATGRDGAVLQFGSPEKVVRLFGHGQTPGPSVTLGELGLSNSGALTALPHGGFAAAWLETEAFPVLGPQTRIVAQRLSPGGLPTGPAVPATPFENSTNFPGIAPLGDGFVVAVRTQGDIRGQRFDATGTAIGGNFFIALEDSIANTRVVALSGDRFLVVWGRDGDTDGQLFDADLNELGAEFTIATSFEPTGLAVNATGTLAALVGVAHAQNPTPRLRFFAPDGSSVGSDIDVAPSGRPDVDSDPSGNFLVMAGFQARAYDSAGAPLGPSVNLGPFGPTGVLHGVHLTGRSEGGFFAMQSTFDKTYVGRITLCASGSAVCGDGTLVPTCEVCDDGAGNSDAMPDACRSDCRPARCGDGVTDGGEQCDDGNHANCDGCTELCDLETGTVCGDGLPAPVYCNEQCDDANVVGGDGCSNACKLERILGGGKLATDCYAAWRIDNPSNDPRFDKRFGVNPKQRCQDNDPACDFDGGVAGSCTFHLAVCVNNAPIPGCTPDRLQSWSVASPTAKQALTRPVLAAVRSVLAGAVVSSVVGSSDPNVCSPNAGVVLPLRGGPGAFKVSKLTLKTRAALYDGAVDTDKMQLRCDP